MEIRIYSKKKLLPFSVLKNVKLARIMPVRRYDRSSNVYFLLFLEPLLYCAVAAAMRNTKPRLQISSIE